MSAQLQSTETRMPAWHQHSIESDRLHMCQMCSTSWWKSWRSRCLSIDVERTSPAAVAAEPSACHCRWSHESHCRSVGMSAAGSNSRRRTQDAANNVLDVVAVLVIFFEAKLVRALQHSLGVVKPATRDWDRILPEKQQRTPHKVGHYVLTDKLWNEIVLRCKHRSIQRVRRPRHQRVHDTKRRCATRDEHCQQLI